MAYSSYLLSVSAFRVFLAANLIVMVIFLRIYYFEQEEGVQLVESETPFDNAPPGVWDESRRGTTTEQSNGVESRMLTASLVEEDSDHSEVPHAASTIQITSWTLLQPDRLEWFEDGEKAFKTCNNLESWMKCNYKFNRSEDQLKRSDAVLFHARHYLKGHGDTPPTYRSPHQKWVFYESEGPTNVWNYVDRTLDLWKHFNITATYTLDSDIPLDNHRMVCTKKETKPERRYIGKWKKKKVAWFVSHCETSSRRELYVKELAKYIDVDIFGACGNDTVCQQSRHGDCTKHFLSDYKFYLSFENAFCQDYYTEKFHDVVKMDILPIVLGKADYGSLLPKESFIDVRDFNSPRSLAQHLNRLDKNDRLYDGYLTAKNSYDCKIMYDAKHRFECKLCEYLHRHRDENQQIIDVSSFWSVSQRCDSPKNFYRGIADGIIPQIKFDHHPNEFL